MRWEWFRDQKGLRYAGGEASYYDVTAVVNWKPENWLMVHPEVCCV